MRLVAGSAGRRQTWRWRRDTLASAVAVAALLVALAGAGRADAADGAAAGAGLADNGAPLVPAQARLASVAVAPLTPLIVLGSGTEALTCVQSPVAIDAAGRSGVLAPQVGATVIRGSAAPSPSVTWVVVPAGRVGDGGTAITVCVPIQ